MKFCKIRNFINHRSLILIFFSIATGMLPFVFPGWADLLSDLNYVHGYGYGPDRPIALDPGDEHIFATGPVTLRSGPFSDVDGHTHKETTWQVRRTDKNYYCDYDWSFNHIVIDEPDLMTVHTVFGLEPGLKYAWRVSYEDSTGVGSKWSDERTFKIGIPETTYIRDVKKGDKPSDFRMISFTQWPVDPSSVSVFGDIVGQNYGKYFRIATYDPNRTYNSSTGYNYVEYGDMEIEPGRAYWFITLQEDADIPLNGIPVSLEHDIEVKLHYNPVTDDGWNMIACPNDKTYDWNKIQVKQYDFGCNTKNGPDSPDNNLVSSVLWKWKNGDYVYYDAGDPEGFNESLDAEDHTLASDSLMRPKMGYWVRAKKENVVLVFSADHDSSDSETMTAGIMRQGKRLVKKGFTPRQAIADSGDAPPGPPRLADNAGFSGADSGSSGCFIAGSDSDLPADSNVMILLFFIIATLIIIYEKKRQ